MNREIKEGAYVIPLPEGAAARDLFIWWMDTTLQDFEDTVPKIDEYSGTRGGSADLRVMGDSHAELLGWENVPPAVAMQLACWHYLVGKTSRMISDFQQRRMAKSDTLKDAAIYALMMRRLGETGNWP